MRRFRPTMIVYFTPIRIRMYTCRRRFDSTYNTNSEYTIILYQYRKILSERGHRRSVLYVHIYIFFIASNTIVVNTIKLIPR